MYESKKSSGRKDIYKYQKSSYQRHFHNSTHFNHHRYTKYKQKYDYSYSPNDLDEELIFKKVFDEKKSSNRKNFKELNEVETTPNPHIKEKKDKEDNKENYQMNSNINDLETNVRTNDENVMSEKNETDSEKINNENIINFVRKDSEEFLIEEKEGNNKKDIKDEILNEIKNLSNLNNINFNFNNNENININNFNFNVENAFNDLLNKNNNNNIFASNEKENIHIDYKKNIYKTPQPFKNSSSNSINLSTNELKEAYYVPRKLSTIYDMYNTQQQPNFFERKQSLNNFNFLTTIKKPQISLSNKQNNNLNNIGINNSFIPFNYSSSNNLNNFNIPHSHNIPITSFNLFEPNNININNIPNLAQCLNSNNNSHHNINKNPFHNMMPQFELNQCILKTQINNNNLFEKDKENTDILEINVKISTQETLTFKIRRYDDMFKTVKIFCEINKLDIKLIRPLIIYIIKALNSIYGIYNLKLKREEIEFLKELKNRFYKEENRNNEELNKNNNDDEEKDEDDWDEEEENEKSESNSHSNIE